MSVEINTPEEELLIKRASDGDREAFGEIVKLYQKLVYNSVKSRLGNEDDTMDVCQDIFVKLWRTIGKYRGDCRFSTWVYRITVNACLDFLRHAKFTATEPMPTYIDKDGDEVEAELADDTVAVSPEGAAVRKETVKLVRESIARLPSEQREVVVLRDLEGLSYEKIAEMLGLEVGTVKSRINRARLRLREIIAERM